MDSYQLGKAVRDTRLNKNLSQAEVARMASTGRRFIVDLEAGKPTVELGKALKVMDVLDVTLGKPANTAELIRAMEIPRLWSAPDEATPTMLFVNVIKNPTFNDLLRVVKVYGVKPLKDTRRRLVKQGDISDIAAKETARMLKSIEAGLRAAA